MTASLRAGRFAISGLRFAQAVSQTGGGMDFIFDRTYRVIRFLLDVVIGNVATLVLFLGTALAIAEVFRRYIIGDTFEWGQDAVTYGVVSSVFLYFAVTQARRSHLRVSFVVDALEQGGKTKTVLAIRALMTAISLALFTMLAVWGIPTVERSMMMERTTASMVLQIWPFQMSLVITFVLMAIVSFFQLYQDIRALLGKKVFEWAPTEEGIDI
jgi:TRAP-type C4-dicarboxylate transport system permease small subunit